MAETATLTTRNTRTWRPFALVVLASALAHLWCLGAVFYMDDIVGIRDSELIREGRLPDGITLRWTVIGYILQYRFFGMSPVGFHAVNWLLHTGVACALLALARDLLKEGREPAGTALFAALCFAVHPLASEIPNYARTQDLAWVTLFSLLACLAVRKFMATGSPAALAGCLAALAGATLSKGPGLFHALMITGMVAAVSITPAQRNLLAKRGLWLVGGLLAGFAVLWATGVLPRWFGYAQETWGTPRFIGHAYTLARVFWEFAWRAVIPVRLCSDHQIAETMVPPGAGWFDILDKVALLAAAGMLALTVLGLWLVWRKPTRVLGLCMVLFTGTMLFRVMYVVPEFMPEYRIYPGMPWFCLGAAVAAAAVWRRLPGAGSPRWLAISVLAAGIVLSARRSWIWHDHTRLNADVLAQYPAQGRAVWKLHDRDMDHANWDAIIARQRTMWPPVFESFISQSRKLAPARDLNSGHFALADVASHGRYAIALAHAQGPAAGIAEIRKLEARMRQLGISEETNRTIWGYFHHARAVVMEHAGRHAEALESMRFEGVFKIKPADIARVEGKLAGQVNQ